MISWDRKRKGSVENEMFPPPSEETKRLEALLFCRYNLRMPADEDAGETAANRLKRQLNEHCSKSEDILRKETRNGKTAETRIVCTKPGNKTELVKREEPEQSQLKAIATEGYVDAVWTYIRGLARAGVGELQDEPSAAETEGLQAYDYEQIPLAVAMSYHSRAKRFAVSLPENLSLAILKEINEAEKMLWTGRVRGPRQSWSSIRS